MGRKEKGTRPRNNWLLIFLKASFTFLQMTYEQDEVVQCTIMTSSQHLEVTRLVTFTWKILFKDQCILIMLFSVILTRPWTRDDYIWLDYWDLPSWLFSFPPTVLQRIPCLWMSVYMCIGEKAARFWRGSNSRPSACKADVITTTPQNHALNRQRSKLRVYFNISGRAKLTATITWLKFVYSMVSSNPIYNSGLEKKIIIIK